MLSEGAGETEGLKLGVEEGTAEGKSLGIADGEVEGESVFLPFLIHPFFRGGIFGPFLAFFLWPFLKRKAVVA